MTPRSRSSRAPLPPSSSWLGWLFAAVLAPWPLTAVSCGGDDSGGADSGGGSGNSGGSQKVGECVDFCVEDSDCGTPTEESCVDGLCLNDCKNKGCVHDGLDCVDLGTVTSCEQICQTDADCGDAKCAGMGADGNSFCVYPGPCTSDADCDEGVEFPNRVCNLETGTCGCSSDDHCAEYWGCAN